MSIDELRGPYSKRYSAVYVMTVRVRQEVDLRRLPAAP